MRKFPEGFQNHIHQECTTLCWLWKITRIDGKVLGFTDHDKNISVEGIIYSANTGFSPSTFDSHIGFVNSKGNVYGALSSEHITHADIKVGLYQNADVEIMRVNWQSPQEYGMIWRGTIGEIIVRDGQVEMVLSGQAAKLERSRGRVFSRECDTELGSERCGITLSNVPNGTTCSRTFHACKTQFNNAKNYRGFPYLIGEDANYAAPLETDVKDGGSRYSQNN